MSNGIKICYIGHCAEKKEYNNRSFSPASNNKIQYILSVIKELGYETTVLSFAPLATNKIVKIGKNKVDNKYIYVNNTGSNNRIIRYLLRRITNIKARRIVKQLCKDKKTIFIIYHSTSLYPIINLLKKSGSTVILELEEIYSDVKNSKITRKKETKVINKADGYIIPTELLKKEISGHKPTIIIYGSYEINNKYKKRKNNSKIIHCVYAGTLDERKGAWDAIESIKYLPNNYCMHILGYGNDQQIRKIKEKCQVVRKETKSIVRYDGVLLGEKYDEYLNNMNIGLCTQKPNATYNNTSFPSKILSYMAHNLDVVSINIRSINTSKLAANIYFYEKNNPKEIAEAIKSVKFKNNNIDTIIKLSEEFKTDLKTLIAKLNKEDRHE